MLVTFGMHRGMPVELLLLHHPYYVRWALTRPEPSSWLLNLQKRARTLIAAFDRKPLQTRCTRTGCRKRAAVCTVYRGDVGPRWWCKACDPVGEERRVRNVAIRSFRDACEYASNYCPDPPEALRVLVRQLAMAKGLPDRADANEARDFFRDD